MTAPYPDRRLGYFMDAATGEKLHDIVNAARDLINHGLRLTPDGLIVREKADKSDPHYRLCKALERLDDK